jgi:arylsulfatase
VPQKAIEGVSMAYTFDGAKAPSERVTQYFEMLGNRAVYHDGWVAGCLHGRLPWETGGGGLSFDEDTWELYNIEEDFSQANDLAAKEAGKLRDLQDRFMAEAAKYNVLPLDDRFAQRADPSNEAQSHAWKEEVRLSAGNDSYRRAFVAEYQGRPSHARSRGRNTRRRR